MLGVLWGRRIMCLFVWLFGLNPVLSLVLVFWNHQADNMGLRRAGSWAWSLAHSFALSVPMKPGQTAVSPGSCFQGHNRIFPRVTCQRTSPSLKLQSGLDLPFPPRPRKLSHFWAWHRGAPLGSSKWSQGSGAGREMCVLESTHTDINTFLFLLQNNNYDHAENTPNICSV